MLRVTAAWLRAEAAAAADGKGAGAGWEQRPRVSHVCDLVTWHGSTWWRRSPRSSGSRRLPSHGLLARGTACAVCVAAASACWCDVRACALLPKAKRPQQYVVVAAPALRTLRHAIMHARPDALVAALLAGVVSEFMASVVRARFVSSCCLLGLCIASVVVARRRAGPAGHQVHRLACSCPLVVGPRVNRQLQEAHIGAHRGE